MVANILIAVLICGLAILVNIIFREMRSEIRRLDERIDDLADHSSVEWEWEEGDEDEWRRNFSE